MPTILALNDGHSREATRCAASLAQLIDADLVIADVFTDVGTETAMARSARGRELGDAARGLDVTRRQLPSRDTAWELVTLGHELTAAAIVVGPDLPRHATMTLLAGSDRPVVIAAGDSLTEAEDTPRIGVAFDDSPSSHRALAAAVNLATPQRVPIQLLGVVSSERRRDEMRRTLASAVRDTTAVPITAEVLVGPSVEMLRLIGRELDLLCCGARNRHRILGGRLGSTSHQLATDPPCDLMVIGNTVPLSTLQPQPALAHVAPNRRGTA